jgi:hypothetical protein
MSFDTKTEAEIWIKQQRIKHGVPDSWKERVWDNLGWHACFNIGGFSVHTSIADRNAGESWYAYLSGEPGKPGGGSGMWTNVNRPPLLSPQEAILDAFNYAVPIMHRIMEVLIESNRVVREIKDHAKQLEEKDNQQEG